MDDGLRELYQEVILDHSRHPRHFGVLEAPTHTGEGYNPLCGDRVKLFLVVDGDGRITDVKFDGKGCAISQASASMLTEEIKGMKLEDVARLSKDIVLENVGIGISPTRMKCAMLGLRVLKSAAIGEIAGWPDED